MSKAKLTKEQEEMVKTDAELQEDYFKNLSPLEKQELIDEIKANVEQNMNWERLNREQKRRYIYAPKKKPGGHSNITKKNAGKLKNEKRTLRKMSRALNRKVK